MFGRISLCAAVVALCAVGLTLTGRLAADVQQIDEISGNYLETRTCDVYTGPCFANAQVGLTGQQAIMAWSIESGAHEGVDLSGLNVVLVVRAADTLGFGGNVVVRPDPIRSVVLLDERATDSQRAALTAFVKRHAAHVAGDVVRVASLPIEMKFDHIDLECSLEAGKEARLVTRRLVARDRCCTNEEIFYPPLAEVEHSEPAFTIDGGYSGRGLGQTWSNPKTRSSFLATFAY
ncbi:MAG TPA: DUF1326 domain-containing protein [Pirellulales bacterium]|nr:DUF1326 domain-containing protein [Pirellulales bacterium]